LLVQCDKDFTANQPEGRWEDDYAGRLIEHFAA
jgi:hypothetical protein